MLGQFINVHLPQSVTNIGVRIGHTMWERSFIDRAQISHQFGANNVVFTQACYAWVLTQHLL